MWRIAVIPDNVNPNLAPVPHATRIPIACPKPAFSSAVPDLTQKWMMGVAVTAIETARVDDAK